MTCRVRWCRKWVRAPVSDIFCVRRAAMSFTARRLLRDLPGFREYPRMPSRSRGSTGGFGANLVLPVYIRYCSSRMTDCVVSVNSGPAHLLLKLRMTHCVDSGVPPCGRTCFHIRSHRGTERDGCYRVYGRNDVESIAANRRTKTCRPYPDWCQIAGVTCFPAYVLVSIVFASGIF